MFRFNYSSLQKMMVLMVILFVVERVYGMRRAPMDPTLAAKRVAAIKSLERTNIDLLREICAGDTSAGKDNLKNEIAKLPLDKLIAIRNYTQQQGFSRGGDSCYVAIDDKIDTRLAQEVTTFISGCYNENCNEKLRNTLQKLSESVGKIIFKKIENSEAVKKIEYKITNEGSAESQVEDESSYFGARNKGNLNEYLTAVKFLVERQVKERKARDVYREVIERERKKWFWQRWLGW